MCISYLGCDKPSSDLLSLSQELREELQRLKDQTTPNHQVGDLEFIAKLSFPVWQELQFCISFFPLQVVAFCANLALASMKVLLFILVYFNLLH